MFKTAALFLASAAILGPCDALSISLPGPTLNIHNALKSEDDPMLTKKDRLVLGAMAASISTAEKTKPAFFASNNTWLDHATNPWLSPRFMEYAPTFHRNPGVPSMRTCFTYMVHNEDTIRGVIRTVALLWDPKDCFVIHIDYKAWAKNLTIIDWLKAEENQLPNVYIIDAEDSVNVLYAGFAQVEGMLKLQEYALKVFDSWDRILFMGGQHIPLMLKSEMDEYFAERDGLSIVPAVKCNRLTAFTNLGDCNRKLHNGIPYIGKEKFPKGGEYYKGLTYTVFTRDFVQLGVFENPDLEYYKSYFSKDFTCSDESFFTTLFYTSPDFKNRATDHDPFPMYTVFPNPFDTHPAILDTPTALKLRANNMMSPRLFARKYTIDEADNALSTMFGVSQVL